MFNAQDPTWSVTMVLPLERWLNKLGNSTEDHKAFATYGVSLPFHPNQNVILDLSGISIVEHHWQQRIKPTANPVWEAITNRKGRSIHGEDENGSGCVRNLLSPSYPGCWHLKPQLSSSSWDARGFLGLLQVGPAAHASWPTSSPSSTACRVSSSSWCTASSASRYHCLDSLSRLSHPQSSEMTDLGAMLCRSGWAIQWNGWKESGNPKPSLRSAHAVQQDHVWWDCNTKR